jgi:predicted nucleic acid-binding protein
MPTLVDADVLIDVLRGDSPARARLQRERSKSLVYGSVVTRLEVLAGMRAGEEEDTLASLKAIKWLPIDQVVADRAAQFSRVYRGGSPGIGLADYLVAATADLLGLRLLTRNVRHFPMFKRLEPAY